jgi:protein involved in temperature-dependent protein secretion
MDEHDADQLLHTALALHRDGDHEGAARLYREILAALPGHATASLNLASIALDRDQLDEAIARLQGVIARDEDSGLAHLLYARALFRAGRGADAMPHIRAAHEIMPEDETAAAEYVSAVRRRWYTFDAAEYQSLLQQAQAGTLPETDRQRLAQLALLRMLRPELLRLVVEPGLPQESHDAVTRWYLSLPEDARPELALLARNFLQAVELMQQSPLFQPCRARLTLRAGPDGAGHEQAVDALEDADSLTGATLELVTSGELRFVPFSTIRSIEFHDPAAATGALVTLRDGSLLSGLMPLFYVFTEFARDDRVRQGLSTLVRPLVPGAHAGVGIRTLRAGDGFIPVVRVERVDFEEGP